MSKPIEMPAGIEAITPDWLDGVLRKTGSIHQTRVESLKKEPIGEKGFTGQLARFELGYSSAQEELPASLIAKTSSSDPGLRAAVHAAGFYEKEIRFYQDLAPQTPLPTPRCYYGDIDRETGHSILLLEDLTRLRSIDPVTGCDLAETEVVLRHLAELHAHWWASPLLQSLSYMPSLDRIARPWHERYRDAWAQFPQRMAGLLPDYRLPGRFLELGDRFCHESGGIFSALAQPPCTLVHMDFHLGNILFGAADNDETFMVFDWQAYGLGRGIVDVTYLMISAVPTRLRRKAERMLLRAYHDLLVQHGVEGYSFAKCWSDYQRAFFWNLLVLVVVAMADMPQAVGRSHIEAVLSRVTAFSEDHALERYL